MDSDRFIAARRMRHILTPWFILLATPVLAVFPFVGPIAAGILVVIGLLTTLRVFAYGHWIQGLAVGFLLVAMLVSLPELFMRPFEEMRAEASSWRKSGLAMSSNSTPRWRQQPNPAPPQPKRTARAAPSNQGPTRPVATAPQKPAPAPEPTFTTNQVREFVTTFHGALNRREISTLLPSYGTWAAYRGENMRRSELKRRILNEWAASPVTATYQMSDLRIETLRPNGWRASFKETASMGEIRQRELILRVESDGLAIHQDDTQVIRTAPKPHENKTEPTPEDEVRNIIIANRKAEANRDLRGPSGSCGTNEKTRSPDCHPHDRIPGSHQAFRTLHCG